MYFFSAFVIKHFSDTVQYLSNGFLEKNRDTISKELVNVMRDSNLPICRSLMALEAQKDARPKETGLDGRVKINAAKHLVCFWLSKTFFVWTTVFKLYARKKEGEEGKNKMKNNNLFCYCQETVKIENKTENEALLKRKNLQSTQNHSSFAFILLIESFFFNRKLVNCLYVRVLFQDSKPAPKRVSRIFIFFLMKLISLIGFFFKIRMQGNVQKTS